VDYLTVTLLRIAPKNVPVTIFVWQIYGHKFSGTFLRLILRNTQQRTERNERKWRNDRFYFCVFRCVSCVRLVSCIRYNLVCPTSSIMLPSCRCAWQLAVGLVSIWLTDRQLHVAHAVMPPPWYVVTLQQTVARLQFTCSNDCTRICLPVCSVKIYILPLAAPPAFCGHVTVGEWPAGRWLFLEQRLRTFEITVRRRRPLFRLADHGRITRVNARDVVLRIETHSFCLVTDRSLESRPTIAVSVFVLHFWSRSVPFRWDSTNCYAHLYNFEIRHLCQYVSSLATRNKINEMKAAVASWVESWVDGRRLLFFPHRAAYFRHTVDFGHSHFNFASLEISFDGNFWVKNLYFWMKIFLIRRQFSHRLKFRVGRNCSLFPCGDATVWNHCRADRILGMCMGHVRVGFRGWNRGYTKLGLTSCWADQSTCVVCKGVSTCATE